MSPRRLHPMLANVLVAAVATALVITVELLLLRREVGWMPLWGVRGVVMSIPVRFVLYLVGYSLMHGWRRERPVLSLQCLGGAICGLTTLPWAPLELAWEALATVPSP